MTRADFPKIGLVPDCERLPVWVGLENNRRDPVYSRVQFENAGMERKTGTNAYVREIEYLKQTGKELNA